VVSICALTPGCQETVLTAGALAAAGYEGYRLYEQLKPQPKVVPVTTPAAKPVLQNSGKQTRCTNTGIDWSLGFCTYSCDDEQPEVTPIPPGGR